MSLTEWRYKLQIICKDLTLGRQMAQMIASFPTDTGAEEDMFPSTANLTPTGWAAQTIVKQNVVDAVDAIQEDASISDPRLSYLVDRGLTEATLDLVKSNFILSYYETIKEDGTVFVTDSAMETLINSNGYVRT